MAAARVCTAAGSNLHGMQSRLQRLHYGIQSLAAVVCLRLSCRSISVPLAMVALVLVRTLAMCMAGTLQSAERAAGEPTAWKCCHPVRITVAGRFHVHVHAIVQLDIAQQFLSLHSVLRARLLP